MNPSTSSDPHLPSVWETEWARAQAITRACTEFQNNPDDGVISLANSLLQILDGSSNSDCFFTRLVDVVNSVECIHVAITEDGVPWETHRRQVLDDAASLIDAAARAPSLSTTVRAILTEAQAHSTDGNPTHIAVWCEQLLDDPCGQTLFAEDESLYRQVVDIAYAAPSGDDHEHQR